ncbi:MAG: extracellular solute-binding protein, partial [Leeuwenhoekiella sp.]
VKKYPGTFTIGNDFSGMTQLKSFLAELGGSPNSLNGGFSEEKYSRLSAQLWEYINRNKKYFWKEGETFPKEQTKMSQLFANGELYLGFGFSEGGIEEKVQSGLYPKTVRSYPWDNGTIKNTNYLGVLKNAPQKAGAIQIIDFLLSPAAQFEKSRADGMDSNTVLTIDRLPSEWATKFNNAPHREYGLEMEDLKEYAIEEPAPEYMIRLYEDFRTQVIEK